MDIKRNRTIADDHNDAFLAYLAATYLPGSVVPTATTARQLGVSIPTVTRIRRDLEAAGTIRALVVRGPGGGVRYEVSDSAKAVA